MAGTTFNRAYMAKVTSSGNSLGFNVWSYNGLTAANASTVAQIAASGFFNSFMQNLTTGDGPLQIGDTIIVSGSDANGMYKVTAITTNVTVGAFAAANAVDTANLVDGAVTTAKLAADAVDNTKLADNAVSLENLDAAITPSHVVKFAGQETTVGGAAAEAFTVAGILTTDLAFVQVVADGTGNVTVLQAVCTADTLTVTFSADPVADTVFNYQILRAAS